MTTFKFFIAGLISFALMIQASDASTALRFPNSSDFSTAVNVDWMPNAVGTIIVNKRGYLKTSADLHSDKGLNKFQWRSKYGSVSTTFFGREFPVGGINEKGLIVHFLKGAPELPDVDGTPSLTHMQLGQYLLDSAATLDEAAALIAKIRPSDQSGGGIHYWICDKETKCAIVDYVAKQLRVYRDNHMPVSVLTNTPYHLAIKQYFECTVKGCSGLDNSLERFMTGAGFVTKRKLPVLQKEATEMMLKTAEVGPTIYTLWMNAYLGRTENRLDIFSPQGDKHQWIDFSKLNFSCQQPTQIQYIDFAQNGDKSSGFQNYDVKFQKEMMVSITGTIFTQDVIDKMIAYPDSITDCQ